MSGGSWAERFEDHRAHLRGVAYRTLGSLSEADDAVQDAWLHVNHADTSEVANIRGWLARRAIAGGACAARPALVDGDVGVVVAPRGRLMMVLAFTVADGKIAAIDAIADPERVRRLDLAILSD